jgi:hypothetical protein
MDRQEAGMPNIYMESREAESRSSLDGIERGWAIMSSLGFEILDLRTSKSCYENETLRKLVVI